MTFGPTDQTSLSQCFNVTILDDNDFECGQEFVVLIGTSIPEVSEGTPNTTVVIVSDDGEGFVCMYIPYSSMFTHTVSVIYLDMSISTTTIQVCGWSYSYFVHIF